MCVLFYASSIASVVVSFSLSRRTVFEEASKVVDEKGPVAAEHLRTVESPNDRLHCRHRTVHPAALQ
jgi:hypothetical protein